MGLPVKEKITLYDNSVRPIRFPVPTTESASGWVFQGYVYHASAPGTKLVTINCSWNATDKKGFGTYDPAEVATALAGAKSRQLLFVILGKPGTDYPVPFYEGSATLRALGPAWAV